MSHRVPLARADLYDSARSRHDGPRARAFNGEDPLLVDLQAMVRGRMDRERSAVVTSGVPSARVHQVLAAVLKLPSFANVEPRMLRVDVHRAVGDRYQHMFGLALAVAMVASFGRIAIPPQALFLGDVGLDGQVRDVPAAEIDRLNDAIARFEVETPITIVLAHASAVWINASSTVQVVPVRDLVATVEALWPQTPLYPH